MCFRAIIPQNKNLKNCWKQINYFPRERGQGGGGYPSIENSMEIINIFFEPFPIPNVSKEIEDDEENYFNFIDSEGNLTDQSHYFFYSMTAVFCVSSVLICIFRKQLMQLCNCCCPRPTFAPKVTYHTSNEKLNIVDVNNMKTEEQTDKKFCLVSQKVWIHSWIMKVRKSHRQPNLPW